MIINIFYGISITISIFSLSYQFYILNKKINNLNNLLKNLLIRNKNKKIKKNTNQVTNMLTDYEYIIL
jgi:hypothetical protein